jgi:hypothetical protein
VMQLSADCTYSIQQLLAPCQMSHRSGYLKTAGFRGGGAMKYGRVFGEGGTQVRRRADSGGVPIESLLL